MDHLSPKANSRTNKERPSSLDVGRSMLSDHLDTPLDKQKTTSETSVLTSDQTNKMLRRDCTQADLKNIKRLDLAIADARKQLLEGLTENEVLLRNAGPSETGRHYQKQVELYKRAKGILNDFEQSFRNGQTQTAWDHITQEASKNPDEAYALIANTLVKQEIMQLADQCHQSYNAFDPKRSQLKERVLLPLVKLAISYKDQYFYYYKYDYLHDYKGDDNYEALDHTQVYLDDQKTEHQSEMKFRATTKIFQIVENGLKFDGSSPAITSIREQLQDTLRENKIFLRNSHAEYDKRKYEWLEEIYTSTIENLKYCENKQQERDNTNIQSLTAKFTQVKRAALELLPQLTEKQQVDLNGMLVDTSKRFTELRQHLGLNEETESTKIGQDQSETDIHTAFIETMLEQGIAAEFEDSCRRLIQKIIEISVVEEASNIKQENDLAKGIAVGGEGDKLIEQNKKAWDQQNKARLSIDKWHDKLIDSPNTEDIKIHIEHLKELLHNQSLTNDELRSRLPDIRKMKELWSTMATKATGKTLDALNDDIQKLDELLSHQDNNKIPLIQIEQTDKPDSSANNR